MHNFIFVHVQQLILYYMVIQRWKILSLYFSAPSIYYRYFSQGGIEDREYVSEVREINYIIYISYAIFKLIKL